MNDKRRVLESLLKRGPVIVLTRPTPNSTLEMTLDWHGGIPLEINDLGVRTSTKMGAVPVPIFVKWEIIEKMTDTDGYSHAWDMNPTRRLK